MADVNHLHKILSKSVHNFIILLAMTNEHNKQTMFSYGWRIARRSSPAGCLTGGFGTHRTLGPAQWVPTTLGNHATAERDGRPLTCRHKAYRHLCLLKKPHDVTGYFD